VGSAPPSPACKVCGLPLHVRECTSDKCRDADARWRTKGPARPIFGRANILTSSQKEERKKETEEEREQRIHHEYVIGNLVKRRQWVDYHEQEVEWAEEESTRYTTISMQLRAVNPDWPTENVRAEALRLVKLEKGGRQQRRSYLPKK
jgi:hypothetical protein